MLKYTNLRAKVQVYIPAKVRYEPDVVVAVNDITKVAGGLSTTIAYGEWFDEEGVNHLENVYVCNWLYPTDRAFEIYPLVEKLIEAMLGAGELAVLVDHIGAVDGRLYFNYAS